MPAVSDLAPRRSDIEADDAELRRLRRAVERGIAAGWRAEDLVEGAARCLSECADARDDGVGMAVVLELAAVALRDLEPGLSERADVLAATWRERSGDGGALRHLHGQIGREVLRLVRIRDDLDRALADNASRLARC